MTNAKHTPGPWFASQYDKTTDLWEVYQSGSDKFIAGDMRKEDALLSAVAPKLLEALESMLKYAGYRGNKNLNAYPKPMADALAIIAEARGK